MFLALSISTFLPLRVSPSTAVAGWSCNPGREAGGGAEEEGWQTRIQKEPAFIAPGLYFCLCKFPRYKSRVFLYSSQLAIGGGWLSQGTKAVIGSLIMINPTLIRKKKNPPTVFCLFAAAGRDWTKSAVATSVENARCECLCCVCVFSFFSFYLKLTHK